MKKNNSLSETDQYSANDVWKEFRKDIQEIFQKTSKEEPDKFDQEYTLGLIKSNKIISERILPILIGIFLLFLCALAFWLYNF